MRYSHLFSPINKYVNGHDPVDVLFTQMDYDKEEWEEYTGPVAGSEQYDAKVHSFNDLYPEGQQMKTEIIVITDRSGSMQAIRQDAIGGFATFIKEQKAVPGEARVTNVIFDDVVETQYQALALDKVPPLDLSPRGTTALNDAIGKTLNVQGKRIADEKWAELVVAVVITDGGENASREFTTAQVKDMITHAEKNGWKFVFLAANQDAFATGAGYGISPQFTSNFAATPQGTQVAYATASASVRSLRGGDPGDPAATPTI